MTLCELVEYPYIYTPEPEKIIKCISQNSG
jgi:hypothetical protein